MVCKKKHPDEGLRKQKDNRYQNAAGWITSVAIKKVDKYRSFTLTQPHIAILAGSIYGWFCKYLKKTIPNIQTDKAENGYFRTKL